MTGNHELTPQIEVPDSAEVEAQLDYLETVMRLTVDHATTDERRMETSTQLFALAERIKTSEGVEALKESLKDSREM